MPADNLTANALGEAAQSFGRADYAALEGQLRPLLIAQPDHATALALLGSALQAQGRYGEAIAVFSKLTALAPTEPAHWINLGSARRGNGDPDGALPNFARAAELGADSADFCYNVALAHMQRNDYESARALLAKASGLAPADLEIRHAWAQCCFERQRTDEALLALKDWELYAQPDDPAIADIGQMLLLLGEPDRAERAVELAASAARSQPGAKLKLVQLLERTNRLDLARQKLNQLLADPAARSLDNDLQVTEAQLTQREGNHERASELYRQSLAQCEELHLRHYFLYPLAKSLDAMGQYAAAWATLVEAHDSQGAYLKRAAPLASLRGAPMMTITRYSTETADVARWDPADGPPAGESPVFIVAFPRSGTTLLELALDAHPQLRSMDEQPFLHNALDDLSAGGGSYPERLGGLDRAQLDRVRQRYWERVRSRVSLEPGQRLVDKNPLNLLRLPVIKRLFPNAHVLLAIRHPCDVLLSCFMQHFRAPEFALLCQSLPVLADGYARSFDFWYRQQALLAAQVRELRYETLVAAFESEIRATIDFLGLPWHEAVLAPGRRAEEKRYISTPSYSQVVQPVNSRAVGRWHHYREHFLPVLPVLQPWLERWNYDV